MDHTPKKDTELTPGLYINSDPKDGDDVLSTIAINKESRRQKISIKNVKTIMEMVERSKEYVRPHLN